jgi:prolyl 4-hydroxylase
MIETFILQEYIQDLSVCDDLIKIHTHNKDKFNGTTGVDRKLDYKLKKSTETLYTIDDFIKNESGVKYIKELQNIVNKYIDRYEFSAKTSRWTITQNIKIQFYNKNEGYFRWHTERDSAHQDCVDRHLVFMTYLNDVNDDGETEFYYQNLKIKPQKGKTVIWPADWTHTHRGITSPTQEKYIITGWFNFIN